MKRWALVVAALYGAILIFVATPAMLWVYDWGTRRAPGASTHRAYEWAHIFWGNIVGFYHWPVYWMWFAVLVGSQILLLITPVRTASGRPATRTTLWPTLLVAGLMMGGLAAGVILSLYELSLPPFNADTTGNFTIWGSVLLGALTWAIWAIVFYRMTNRVSPRDVISKQCRFLFAGSVLELLIAVPTNIISRHRDSCCGGVFTGPAIAFGVGVMFLAFGPAVFFLFVERWRKLQPKAEK